MSARPLGSTYDTLSYDRGGVDTTARTSARSGRILVVGVVLAAIAVIAYFALGMPGMDRSPGMATSASSAEVVALDPGPFAARVDAPGAFVVNVNAPDDGVRTDAWRRAGLPLRDR